jgi:uncharacterized protein YegP (UPF0339 family)
MIHINKSRKTGQFIVTVVAENGEKLSSSELLKTRQSAIKNIRAQIIQFGNDSALVQDNTTKDVKVVRVFYYVCPQVTTAFATENSPY